MKKKILGIILITIFSLLIYSCDKNNSNFVASNSELIHSRNINYGNLDNNEDINFNNLAKVVSLALGENQSFRNMVKNEALLTFDGDFDILLKRFKDSTIVFNNESLTVNEFLDIYYKRLGLSVLPFDEYYGYKNNSVLLVDAEIPPNNPIVVIGRNERTDPRPVIISPPDVNIVLQGNTYQGGIKLSWTVSDLNKPISGYNIYRKGESQYDFERVRVNNNKYNTTFEDNDVNSLVSYTYFVRAYNYSGESPPSNYKEVVAPDVPYPVSTFKAIINTNSWAELRWQHKQGQYIDHTDLFKRKFKISQPPEYELIGSFDNDETEYFDLLFPQNGGDRYDYKIVEVSNMGNSNPLYDFITVPTRDIEQASSVRIKQISYVSGKKNEIEG
ncbi:MAG TPA: fibronectin type III domain-containing protein, partial [Bacteroidetes bacterium]|nr:fibronectin type III domain-containing protein [Bacteroidota bacterium]